MQGETQAQSPGVRRGMHTQGGKALMVAIFGDSIPRSEGLFKAACLMALELLYQSVPGRDDEQQQCTR